MLMSEPRTISRTLLPSLGLGLVLALMLTLSGPAPMSSATQARLTNGCTISTRGIPSCGAYVGASYGANSSVTAWERRMHKPLGVHRTFWGGHSVAAAVRTARVDASHHRLPWISFKPPYSWAQMASGRGDAWARGVARQLRSVRGPVWVAIHHEPEGDGNIAQWKAMQKRLAPIMRAAAPNLAYTIILTGYNEFHGPAKYRMSKIWPNTKIDVAGFDIYEGYGVQGSKKWKNFYRSYFLPIQKWARSAHTTWGLAETGYSNAAAKRQPRWMRKVYTQMVNHGGKAFSYFNTNLNSKADWRLGLATKQNAFTRLTKTAPRIR
jgi:hypothetical protein